MKDYLKVYRKTPRGRYLQQKENARKRGIAFELSWEQWWSLWQEHWEQRGRGPGRMVMARHGDIGPYTIGNVAIVPHEQNVWRGR